AARPHLSLPVALPILRVEHVQVIAPPDVDRLVAVHAIASMQPTHATSDMPWAEARIGKPRSLGAYAWRTMLDRHVPLAFGSDFRSEEHTSEVQSRFDL